MTNSSFDPTLEPLRPDYQRFFSPIRRAPIAVCAFTIVILMGSFVLAGSATSEQGVTALVTVVPQVEASALQLNTVLQSAEIVPAGAASTIPTVSAIVGFFQSPGLKTRIGIPADVSLATREIAGTRAEVLVSADTVGSADSAIELLRTDYSRYRNEQIQLDLAATRSGAATQLQAIERQSSALNGQAADPAVLGALATRTAGLEALIESIDTYATDGGGVEFEVARAPTLSTSSRAAQLALGLVIAGLCLAATLGLLFVFDDRVLSRRDLLRAAPGIELIGIVEDENRTGVFGMRQSLERLLSRNGDQTIQIHATSRPVGDLASELAEEFSDATPVPTVHGVELESEEGGLRRASRSVDVIVVDWGKTRRAKLSSTVVQLRFAGADTPTLVLRSVPKKELRAIL